MDKTLKVVLGILGVGGLGYLGWYFSKKAEDIETQTGSENPLARARKEQRQQTAREINDFIHLWGVNPQMMQNIENWNACSFPMRFRAKHPDGFSVMTKPKITECRARRSDLRARGVEWSYVSDYAEQFPQYAPPAEPHVRQGMSQVEIDKILHGGNSHKHLSKLPTGEQTKAVREGVGEDIWDDMPKAWAEELYRDFYTVLKYGWQNWKDTKNGKATLICMGGFPGFVAQWQPPTSDFIASHDFRRKSNAYKICG